MASFLQAENISKQIGDLLLFEDLSLNIDEGEKIALIAKNGTGKTSLLNILAGTDTPTNGTISGKNDIVIGYLPQEPLLNPINNVFEEILHADTPLNSVIKSYEKALAANDQKQLPGLIDQMDQLNAWDYDTRIKTTLGVLNINSYEQKVNTLSGGQQKRLALAKVLLQEPDLLILDEPTNHLDLEMIEWLENHLTQSKATLFMVTHDRYFLDRVCNVIYEIDDHTLYRYQGNYAYYLEKRQERIQQHQASVEKAQNLFRKELDWMRRMPKARGTKAKYRKDAFGNIKEKAHENIAEQQVNITAAGKRMGNKIIEIHQVKKQFGDLKILDNFSYTFDRYEKVGIVGPNGSGKSTLLNLITQQLNPDQGEIITGQTIQFGYYRQKGLHFEEDTKVIDVVREIAETVHIGNGQTLSVTQFLNYFLFPPKTHYNYVRKLSGGEKRRLYLVSILMQNPNFLILDEPTNDLDIHTLNVLEEYLASFRGCVIVVSHDRFFMDKIVDHLFVFEGQGSIKDFPGNYSQYRAWKSEQDKTKTQKTTSSAPAKNKTEEPAAKQSNKLTYKERLELQEVETEIDHLEAEKTQLENEVSSGSLPNDELIEKSEQIAKLMETIEQKTERWMELSEKEQ
ncbi:MAG: ATP-binding cassette domain-containing protein [Bacteroidetes bacterium]|jgi:ATP-binding cassette subfamily F protein uup|nr:ATP-binding cassette domain-containing protein [Bacteroidota bacterium]